MGKQKGKNNNFGGPTNLFDLRGKVKKAPKAYRNDVLRQLNHWQATLKLLKISNTMNTTRARTKELAATIEFLSHVIHKYPNESACRQFPLDLLSLLDQHVETLNPFIRKIIIKGLCLMESNNCIDGIKILPLYFRLLSTQDKTLRYLVYASIVQIIVRINKKSKNQQTNKAIQNYLFAMLQDKESDIAVKKSLSVLIELYRRNIWRNSKIINMIADLCIHSKHPGILRNSLHFMLGHRLSPIDMENDEMSEGVKTESELTKMNEKLRQSHIQKLKFNSKRAKKKMLKIAKIEDELEDKLLSGGKTGELLETDNNQNNNIDLLPIRSIYDSQKFGEKLFQKLKMGTNSNHKILWDVRLLMINLLSKVISVHELFLFPFYTFILRYLNSHQKNVTQIIAYIAQSIHKLVPPDIVEPIIKHICDEFVGQFADDEAIAVGINAIRWICKRQPLCINENNKDLLWDLSMFVKHRKDRGVQMAARGLIQLYRIENPLLLQRRDRGKVGAYFGKIHEKDGGIEHRGYGDVEILTDIKGADLLDEEDRILEEMKIENENGNGNKNEKYDYVFDDTENVIELGVESDSDDENGKQQITNKEWSFLEMENDSDAENDMFEIKSDSDSDGNDDSDDSDDNNSDNKMNGENNKIMTDIGKEKLEIENEMKKEKKKPLLFRRILTDDDLSRIRELRVKNMMKEWNRRREEVALKEDEEEDIDIDPSNIESVTTLQKKRKMARKMQAQNRQSDRMTWDQYSKIKAGGKTNLENARKKPFKMTQRAQNVLKKGKRSHALKSTVAKIHKKRLRNEGKRGKRRRR